MQIGVNFPMRFPGFSGFDVEDGKMFFVSVVAKQQLAFPAIDSLPFDVVAIELVDSRFGPDVPEEHSLVPPSTVEDMRVGIIPFDAEDAVGMGADVASFQGLGVPLVEVAEQHDSILSSHHIPLSVTADFAGLETGLVLTQITTTFLENRSCSEEACQYSMVPPECTHMTAFLIPVLSGDRASPITGVLSSWCSLYCTFHLAVERTLVTPSSQPRHTNLSEAKYSVSRTSTPKFIYCYLQKRSGGALKLAELCVPWRVLSSSFIICSQYNTPRSLITLYSNNVQYTLLTVIDCDHSWVSITTSHSINYPQIFTLSDMSMQTVPISSPNPNHHQQLAEEANENRVLMAPSSQQQLSWYEQLPQPKNILKCIVLLTLLIIIIAFLSYILSVHFLTHRVPESIITTEGSTQVIAPTESDYRSYIFYKAMENKAKLYSSTSQQPTNQDLQQFSNINFNELYDIFKVARAIQLAKEYAVTEEDYKNDFEPDHGIDLNQVVNYTQFYQRVVDQHKCASCYSFPVTATIEYLYKQKYNISVKLSEQQIIDCSKPDENANGCENGDMASGFEYAVKYGLVEEKFYPYASTLGYSFPCKKEIVNNSTIKKYKISGFEKLPKANCDAIRQKIVMGAPVASMIDAERLSDYDKGTFTDCSRTKFDHSVTLVGQNEKSEWIVRNSWGQLWGQNGYFLMGRGNTCGVCSYAMVPILEMKNGKVVPVEKLEGDP